MNPRPGEGYAWVKRNREGRYLSCKLVARNGQVLDFTIWELEYKYNRKPNANLPDYFIRQYGDWGQENAKNVRSNMADVLEIHDAINQGTRVRGEDKGGKQEAGVPEQQDGRQPVLAEDSTDHRT